MSKTKGSLPHIIAEDASNPGTGVVVVLNVTGSKNAGSYLYTGKSFRGLNCTTGGAAMNNGVRDTFYYETAQREFHEEGFAKLVDMKRDGTLGAKLLEWSFTDEEKNALANSLEQLANTQLIEKLKVATSSEKLQLNVPVELNGSDYIRKTYITNPVQVEEADLSQYLGAASKIALIMNSKFNQLMKVVEGKDFSEKKSKLDAIGLTDFTESSAIGLVKVGSVANALKALQKKPFDSNDVEITLKTDGSNKIDKIYLEFYNENFTPSKETAFKASLEGIVDFENTLTLLSQRSSKEIQK